MIEERGGELEDKIGEGKVFQGEEGRTYNDINLRAQLIRARR